MRFSFLPRDKVFYELLEKLAFSAEKAVKVFVAMVNDWRPDHPALQEIRDFENSCDLIVHEIMVKLNKTFVTPIDREDIHIITLKLDDLVDSVHALSERMHLFKIESVTDEMKEMSSVLELATIEVVQVVGKLRNIKDTRGILERCVLIHTLENQGDRLFEKALGSLFQNHTDPMDVIKWKEIYDFLESAVDQCEDIADIMWGIMVKYG